jgi:SAM-dependent methyltransferase
MTGSAEMDGRPRDEAAPGRALPALQGISYDEVPYDSRPLPQTHPGHLAAVATLFGLRPANPRHCRVLELGCASGGNLIPMALTLPGSTFVGIDQSTRQIVEGQRVVKALGLGNVELRHQDILDMGDDFGLFDYILCHGVYSWVPAPVQDKILTICARNLSPEGVAYVSYNTYPGWHLNHVVRDLMAYYARCYPLPGWVAQGRALVEFLARAAPRPDGAYARLLAEKRDLFGQVPDSYLLHDYLEEVNEPVYFREFMGRAAAKGLDYLAEAEVAAMAPDRFAPEGAGTVRPPASNVIEAEQDEDFVRGRSFRQTLLCHRGRAPARVPVPGSLAGLHVASPFRPVPPGPDSPASATTAFHDPRGRTFSATDPVLTAALLCLAQSWPCALSFETLRAGARARLGPAGDPGRDARSLEANLLRLYSCGLVELHACASAFVAAAGERPAASPLARQQVKAAAVVTNLRHGVVPLDEQERLVLRHLDGRRDRAALLAAQANEGTLTLGNDAGALDRVLRGLAGKALLVT